MLHITATFATEIRNTLVSVVFFMLATVKGLRFQLPGEPGSSENRQNVKVFIERFIHPTWAVRLRKEHNNIRSPDGRAIRVVVSDEKGERCAGYISKDDVPAVWDTMGEINEVRALIGEVRTEQYVVVLDEEEIYRKRGNRERTLPDFPYPMLVPDISKVEPKDFIERPFEVIRICLKNRQPDLKYHTENNTKTEEIKINILNWLAEVDMSKRLYCYNNVEVSEILTGIIFLLYLATNDTTILF